MENSAKGFTRFLHYKRIRSYVRSYVIDNVLNIEFNQRWYCYFLEFQCSNWHVYACPEYKHLSSCSKGENCRLPHRNISYFQKNLTDEQTDDDNWRYFEKNAIKENNHPSCSLIPGKETMGILPDFIPL